MSLLTYIEIFAVNRNIVANSTLSHLPLSTLISHTTSTMVDNASQVALQLITDLLDSQHVYQAASWLVLLAGLLLPAEISAAGWRPAAGKVSGS